MNFHSDYCADRVTDCVMMVTRAVNSSPFSRVMRFRPWCVAPITLNFPIHAEGAPGPSLLGTGDGKLTVSPPTDSRLEYPRCAPRTPSSWRSCSTFIATRSAESWLRRRRSGGGRVIATIKRACADPWRLNRSGQHGTETCSCPSGCAPGSSALRPRSPKTRVSSAKRSFTFCLWTSFTFRGWYRLYADCWRE
jgi:hypothetical protein